MLAAMDLHGKTAVITGASRGLGAGLARDFHARGMNLGLCARSPMPLEGAARTLATRLDVGDAKAVAAFAAQVSERFGAIDLWINNAGVLAPIAALRDVSDAEAEAHWRINVNGVLHGTRAFVRQLRARGGAGVLINVSSGAARNAYAGWSIYCAGKAAVDRMTECVQEEERAAGLRAYAVAPGVIDTDMQAQVRASDPDAFPQLPRFLELKRRGAFNTPEIVAEHLLAIAFDPERRPTQVCVQIPMA
jgi:NAD(P)-dependent dehydrogenase (short-subunit alcohol dehydrogenase family)